jgi:hypothetical protein
LKYTILGDRDTFKGGVIAKEAEVGTYKEKNMNMNTDVDITVRTSGLTPLTSSQPWVMTIILIQHIPCHLSQGIQKH